MDSSIDVMNRWTTDQLDGLADEWEKVLRYYLKRKKAGKAFLWGPILDLKKYGENNGESGFCGVGLIQIYIKRKIGKEGNMCSKCSFAVKCQSKNCIMNSLAYSGTVGEHNPDMCYFERKKRNLWEIYAPQL